MWDGIINAEQDNFFIYSELELLRWYLSAVAALHKYWLVDVGGRVTCTWDSLRLCVYFICCFKSSKMEKIKKIQKGQ